jgi:hypothetical protein
MNMNMALIDPSGKRINKIEFKFKKDVNPNKEDLEHFHQSTPSNNIARNMDNFKTLNTSNSKKELSLHSQMNLLPYPKLNLMNKFKDNTKIINNNKLKLKGLKKNLNLSSGGEIASKIQLEKNNNICEKQGNIDKESRKNSYLSIYKNRLNSNSCKNLRQENIEIQNIVKKNPLEKLHTKNNKSLGNCNNQQIEQSPGFHQASKDKIHLPPNIPRLKLENYNKKTFHTETHQNQILKSTKKSSLSSIMPSIKLASGNNSRKNSREIEDNSIYNFQQIVLNTEPIEINVLKTESTAIDPKASLTAQKSKMLEFTFKSSIMKEEMNKLKLNVEKENIINRVDISHEKKPIQKQIFFPNSLKEKLVKFNNLKNVQKMNIKIIEKQKSLISLQKQTQQTYDVEPYQEQLASLLFKPSNEISAVENYSPFQFKDKKLSIIPTLYSNCFENESELPSFGNSSHIINSPNNNYTENNYCSPIKNNPIIKYKSDHNIIKNSIELIKIDDNLNLSKCQGNLNNKPPKIRTHYPKKSFNSFTNNSPRSKIEEYKPEHVESTIFTDYQPLVSHKTSNSNVNSIDSRRKMTPKIIKNHPGIKKFFDMN